MDDKMIYSHRFKLPEKVSVSNDEVKIGGTTIGYYHGQDCCEHVYADFSVFDYFLEAINKHGVTGLQIKKVKDIGFIMFFHNKKFDTKKIGVVVGCYNEQNGYYANDLTLTINENGNTISIDISDSVEDNIC